MTKNERCPACSKPDDDDLVTAEWLQQEFGAEINESEVPYVYEITNHDGDYAIRFEDCGNDIWWMESDDLDYPHDIHAKIQVRRIVQLLHHT